METNEVVLEEKQEQQEQQEAVEEEDYDDMPALEAVELKETKAKSDNTVRNLTHVGMAEQMIKDAKQSMGAMQSQLEAEQQKQREELELKLKLRQERRLKKQLEKQKQEQQNNTPEDQQQAGNGNSTEQGNANPSSSSSSSSSSTNNPGENDDEDEKKLETPHIVPTTIFKDAPDTFQEFLGLDKDSAFSGSDSIDYQSLEASEFVILFRQTFAEFLKISCEDPPRMDPFMYKYKGRAMLLEMKWMVLNYLEKMPEVPEDIDDKKLEILIREGDESWEGWTAPETLSEQLVQDLKDLISVINIFLACNYIDCEENHTGQELLKDAYIRLGRNNDTEMNYVVQTIDAEQERKYFVMWLKLFDQLGLLWCQREDFVKALSMLAKAEQLYCRHRMGSERIESGVLADDIDEETRAAVIKQQEEATRSTLWFHLVGDLEQIHLVDDDELVSTNAEDGITLSSQPTLNVKNKHSIESLYTMCLFYLAQVFTHMRRERLAAIYCHKTLKRQLTVRNYDPLDWATNCMQISSLYLENRNWVLAEHCIRAADAIMPMAEIKSYEDIDDGSEPIVRARANLELAWAHFHMTRLADGSLLKDAQTLAEAGEAVPDTSNTQAEISTEKELEDLMFHELNLKLEFQDGDLLIPQDFDHAREVFLLSLAHFENAKVYYIIDGFVSDHIQILTDVSRLHHHLVAFEKDPERVVKMHKMRIKTIEPLIDELNPNYYLDTVRSMQFLVAEGYFKIHEAKKTMRELGMTHVKGLGNEKMNQVARKSIKYYHEFAETMKDAKDNTMSENGLLEEFERPYLSAKFCMARLKATLITDSPQLLIEYTKEALYDYEEIVQYAKKHPRAEEVFADELNIAYEMVELLPSKLNKMAAAMAAQLR